MTSSVTQTERADKGAPNTPARQSDRQRAEQSAGALPGLPVSSTALVWGVGIVALLGGWISILQVYRWYFTAPVFFLFAGWLAVLMSARSLWRAGMAAAEDTGMGDDEPWKPVGPRDELIREKRSLLKAIKEIEFDHQMGKMSEEDATQLTRFYRLRAIELIKALDDSGEEGAGLSPSLSLSIEKQIEREVKARLTVARTGAKAAAGQSESKRTAKGAKAGKQKGKKRATDEKAPAGEKSSGSGETSGEASTEVGS